MPYEFKKTFLTKMAQEGVTVENIGERICTALGLDADQVLHIIKSGSFKKVAEGEGGSAEGMMMAPLRLGELAITEPIKELLKHTLAISMLGPPALGVGAGYLGYQATKPSKSHALEALRSEDMLRTIKQNTALMQLQNQVAAQSSNQ